MSERMSTYKKYNINCYLIELELEFGHKKRIISEGITFYTYIHTYIHTYICTKVLLSSSHLEYNNSLQSTESASAAIIIHFKFSSSLIIKHLNPFTQTLCNFFLFVPGNHFPNKFFHEISKIYKFNP